MYRLKRQNIGSLAGYPFAPYLSDGIGRRPTVFVGALIMCLATAVQTASQSVGMFIGARYVANTPYPLFYNSLFLRFLIGFGLTFAGKIMSNHSLVHFHLTQSSFFSKRCSFVGHRNFVSDVSCSPYIDVQFSLVFRCHNVSCTFCILIISN